ncbi:LCP family protein [Blautia sp. HCP3S3_H10_1]|uniref:LCP family protein n=1 Tax=unclassified Blautia TaxID=2648079 RepID=UPI003F8EC87A|nr:LCP family protein [Clostridia bacterium]
MIYRKEIMRHYRTSRHNNTTRHDHNNKKKFKYLTVGLAVGVLGIGLTAGVLTSAGNHTVTQGTSSTQEDPDAITYKGVTYVPKGNLETYLFAGIDSPDKVTDIKEYDGTGQCDVLIVLVRDRSTDTCKLLTIDRNTMTPIRSLEDDGTYIDTDIAQISLAHAMSLDHQTRADNTVDAVSTLLGGHKIDGYAMVNMGAITIVNDMVGGVTVTVEDDFPDSDTLIKGQTVTLHGEDAERFIRERKTVGDGLNDNRMNRQAQYEQAFKPVFQAKCSEDKTFPLDLYHAMEDYMTTNISAKKFSRLALLLSDETDEEKLTIDGTDGFDEDGWQTFTPDEDSLQEVILSLFYKEKK